MVLIDDLLYGPIYLKGSRMDANEYIRILADMDTAESDVAKAVRRLHDAANRFHQEGWRDLDMPERIPQHRTSGDPVRSFKVEPWPSLDEITSLIACYWSARKEVEMAWNTLPEETRKAGGLRPPGRPKWD